MNAFALDRPFLIPSLIIIIIEIEIIILISINDDSDSDIPHLTPELCL